MGTDAEGKVFYKNRLSVCEKFRGKTLEERAGLVQLAGGCALCLDWSGDHRAKECKAKIRGKQFEACGQLEGGQPCGKRHNRLLHGTGNNFCNS